MDHRSLLALTIKKQHNGTTGTLKYLVNHFEEQRARIRLPDVSENGLDSLDA